jgi:hypothetical protein
MNSLRNIPLSQKAFAVMLILAAIILVWLAPRAAVNVDEMLHYPHAKKVVNWYFTGGADKSSLLSPVDNLQFYGQSVDNFTALVNRVFNIDKEFITRHYTGAFFFWLLLLLAGMLARKITGNYWVATLSVLFILISPRIFGQAFGNLKDIPFAVGYLAGIILILSYLKQFPQVKWSTVLLLGLAIAYTSSVRIGGLILFAYLAVGIGALLFTKPFLLKYVFTTKSCFVRFLGQGLAIAAIGYFAGLLFWPYALQDVFRHPLESLSVMEHYKVSIKQIFEGDVVWSTQLPWHYLPKWIVISTPVFILLGFIYFLAFLTYNFSKPFNEQLFLELFVLFTLAFPVFYVIYIGSNLYSGLRQMLFVIPLLTVFAAVGVYRLYQSKMIKILRLPALLITGLLMLLPVKHQAITFPVDYVYFNALAGGNKKAWGNYEYDYYFHGIKKASQHLLDEIGHNKVKVAMNCQLPNYFEKHKNVDFVYTRYLERSSADWDYGIFGINYIHPYQLKNNTWQPASVENTFYHRGNPLVMIIKRNNRDAYDGIWALKHREYEKAKELLHKALKTDSNNVWLFVNLANLNLAQHNYTDFDANIKQARAIHPQYEPLYLLEAQKHYNRGEYAQSMEVLNELIAVNPRYKNAKPLLEEVKQKLNK